MFCDFCQHIIDTDDYQPAWSGPFQPSGVLSVALSVAWTPQGLPCLCYISSQGWWDWHNNTTSQKQQHEYLLLSSLACYRHSSLPRAFCPPPPPSHVCTNSLVAILTICLVGIATRWSKAHPFSVPQPSILDDYCRREGVCLKVD